MEQTNSHILLVSVYNDTNILRTPWQFLKKLNACLILWLNKTTPVSSSKRNENDDSNFEHEYSEPLHALSQMPTKTRMINYNEHLIQAGTHSFSLTSALWLGLVNVGKEC